MIENRLIQTDINIQDKIHTIRGLQVMLDRDLAELYRVQKNKLPDDFYFEATDDEGESLRSKNLTLNLSESKEPNSYNVANTPLPPLCNVPKKGFSS